MHSQVLQQLPTEKLPPPEIACRACQHATWMEFRSGPKCYCEITQAWMYQPHQEPSQMVLACDKQIELKGETAAPASRPRQPATKESVTG